MEDSHFLLYTSELMFGRKERREKKREPLRGKEKKERKEFSLIVVPSQSFSLESIRCQLIGKAWRSKRIEEKIFCCENQDTWRGQDLKTILGMSLSFFWFDLCMIHDLLIILVVKIWLSCRTFKSQFCCGYFDHVFF